MNKLIDILRLILTTSFSNAEIARSFEVAKNTVRRYRKLAEEKNCTWEQLEKLEPRDVAEMFNQKLQRLSTKRVPNFVQVYDDLRRDTDMTLQVWWEDYRAANPDDAYSYSQFTELYREFTGSLSVSMRQIHHPGQNVFVDFSGRRPHYVDQHTGEKIVVELFVAAMGCSNKMFALAVPTQSSPDWIYANIKMLEFYGGVTAAIVPDNLKAAVSRAGRNAVINRSYREFATHYGTAIVPTRVEAPQDKAKVENAVGIIKRWILVRLARMTFFSLAELNAEIARLLALANAKPFKRLPGSRESRFQELDRPKLKPLPAVPYEWAEWVGYQKVNPQYHVWVFKHWYSVPYRLVTQSVEARVTRSMVEIFHQGSRVASHARSFEEGGTTTDPSHRPEPHRQYAERTPERFAAWAATVGPNTAAVVQAQFDRDFPALGLPACESLKKLGQQYGSQELEAAATRAVQIRSLTVTSIKSLLRTRMYAREPGDQPAAAATPTHHNVRGAGYYVGEQGG